jgi:methionyl-tRNA synthetase
MPTFEDGDFTFEKFRDAYNANLANGLGNLASRIMKMASANGVGYDSAVPLDAAEKARADFDKAMGRFEIKLAADAAWSLISWADGYIQKEEPFKKIKTDRQAAESDIRELLRALHAVAELTQVILPSASEKILRAVESGSEMPPLFPRIS